MYSHQIVIFALCFEIGVDKFCRYFTVSTTSRFFFVVVFVMMVVIVEIVVRVTCE